ncbi:MAG: hypothetical protein IJP62_09995 [Treponema sp.]|nr:hypothetical protein [Treponema sp.]
MKRTVFFVVVLCSLLAGFFFGCDKDNSYRVYYNKSGADLGSAPKDTNEYKEGDTVELKENLGNLQRSKKQFGGWWILGSAVDDNGEPKTVYAPGDHITVESSNIVLNVFWEDDENNVIQTAYYTVRHYQQNADGSDPSEPTEIESTKKGTVGKLTTAEPKEYTGFTAQEFTQKEVLEDGSTVVEIYYKRNKIYYQFYNNDSEDMVIGSLEGLYGATVDTTSIQPTPPFTGYTFAGWQPELPETFGAENKKFHAQWNLPSNNDEEENNGSEENGGNSSENGNESGGGENNGENS